MKTETIAFPTLNEPVTFYIGSSQQENHDVIALGKPDDLWFHLADMSSAHVVAILPTIKITRKQRGSIIRRGAYLCKIHTAKAASLSSVSVTYSTIKYVTPTSIPGSVLVREAHEITV
jgi:predicted ribosome quality control (RQC) complex YloA/Tae2 family protein